ncbi:Transcriptional regulator, TetR family [Acidisarcina polymorpha]|uniref:Transcriptional regulator, TetR family n=1 Tax=Acidisarcina polymorpha TaxID=2211140 RepID=A0A2Z5G830_9BACT|nr:Transcriptional regulator, TetR family [Acidisarcina polymorpha]
MITHGRQRSQRSETLILRAVGRLLAKDGYAALSIEGVAREAGVGKATIYRWWSGKAHLVLDYYCAAPSPVPTPDSGALEPDLNTFLNDTFKALTSTHAGATMASLMAESQTNPEFGAELRERFISTRREALRSILQAGQKRREIAADTDLDVTIDLLYGAMWYRLLNRHAPLDARFATRLIRQILGGIRGSDAAPLSAILSFNRKESQHGEER